MHSSADDLRQQHPEKVSPEFEMRWHGIAARPPDLPDEKAAPLSYSTHHAAWLRLWKDQLG